MSVCGSWGYAMTFSLEWRMLQGVNISHLLGVSALLERSTYCYMYPLGQNQHPRHGCTILSWLLLLCLCGPSCSWLATVSTCFWDSGKATKAEWNLYPTNKKRRTQIGFHAQEPHRVLLSFSYWILPFEQQNADLKISDWGFNIMTHYM